MILMPLIPLERSRFTDVFWRISNHILCFLWDVIFYPCTDFNAGFIKLTYYMFISHVHLIRYLFYCGNQLLLSYLTALIDLHMISDMFIATYGWVTVTWYFMFLCCRCFIKIRHNKYNDTLCYIWSYRHSSKLVLKRYRLVNFSQN